MSYLAQGKIPDHLTGTRKISFVRTTLPYMVVQGELYRRGPDLEICICVPASQQQEIIAHLHDGPAGGHQGSETTIKKIL